MKNTFEKSKEISYSEYKQYLNDNLFEYAEITGRTFKGKLFVEETITDEVIISFDLDC